MARMVSPEQRELLDAHRRYAELRERHVRRTQVIGGRLWLGRTARPLAALLVYGLALAAVLGTLGIGVDVDGATLQGAAILLAGVFFLVIVGGYQARRRRAGRGPLPTPVREILAGVSMGFIGVCLLVNADAAEIIGFLVTGTALITAGRGSRRLFTAGLRRVFRKRPGPVELQPIEHERPAA